MVFLRPYVLRSADDSTKISNERYDYIIEQQIAVTPAKTWPLPEVPVVRLPNQVE
jgi:type II secretory pathway component GspD/PulD (secretin)